MKKIIQLNKITKAILIVATVSFSALLSCKKSDTIAEQPLSKTANFSVDINGANATGAEYLDFSYLTTNDEYLEIPYAEIHIAGSNTMLDIMVSNPTVKQYSLAGINDEAAVLITANNTTYEATSGAILKITEFANNKISGTISGNFTNTSTGTNVPVSNASFSIQY